MFDTILQAAVNAYDGIVNMFGSPVVLLALAATLVALAVLDLCVKRCAKPATEAN
jgi:hypothetical protein